MDGRELLSILREEYPKLPIITMSGHGEGFIRDSIGDLRVASILRKPFGVAKLTEAVRRHGLPTSGETRSPELAGVGGDPAETNEES